jgi:hypothetical protein
MNEEIGAGRLSSIIRSLSFHKVWIEGQARASQEPTGVFVEVSQGMSQDVG